MSGSRQSATSIHAIMLQSESSIDTNLALTTPLVATHSSPPYMLHLGPDGMPGQLNSWKIVWTPYIYYKGSPSQNYNRD